MVTELLRIASDRPPWHVAQRRSGRRDVVATMGDPMELRTQERQKAGPVNADADSGRCGSHESPDCLHELIDINAPDGIFCAIGCGHRRSQEPAACL